MACSNVGIISIFLGLNIAMLWLSHLKIVQNPANSQITCLWISIMTYSVIVLAIVIFVILGTVLWSEIRKYRKGADDEKV